MPQLQHQTNNTFPFHKLSLDLWTKNKISLAITSIPKVFLISGKYKNTDGDEDLNRLQVHLIFIQQWLQRTNRFFILTTICYDSLFIASCSRSKCCTKCQNNNNNNNNEYIFHITQLFPLWKLILYSQPCIRAPTAVRNGRLDYEIQAAAFHHLTHSKDDATAASLNLRTRDINPSTNINKMCKLLKFISGDAGGWWANIMMVLHAGPGEKRTCRANVELRTGSFICEEPFQCWSKPVNMSRGSGPQQSTT